MSNNGEQTRRRRDTRSGRLRLLGLAFVLAVLVAVIVVFAASGRKPGKVGAVQTPGRAMRRPPSTGRARRPARHLNRLAATDAGGPPYAVGIAWLRFVDASRTITLPGGTTAPRTLLTSVRYPATGSPGGGERRQARPATGPFPLIVFGHGFAVTPGIYARLLDAWAAAGYVVAAPAFPLGNANAPGGPNEHDLPNQPRDVSFVISRLLAADAAARGPLHDLIEPHAIAVSGQSDGGDTALAVAFDPRVRDPRISAAAILSGGYDPFASTFPIAAGGPALLATQGTADDINPPSATAAFYDGAPAPKYLLQLLGASHLPPYTDGEPQLGVVERVTTAFFDEYLKHRPAAARRMERAGNVAGVSVFSADP